MRAVLPAIFALAAALVAQPPASPPQWRALAIVPGEVKLHCAADHQGVLALATKASGATLDVTAQLQWSVTPEGMARLEQRTSGLWVVPLRDGTGELVAEGGELRAAVPLEIRGAGFVPPVSFANDVVPILTRAGCNAGSCHGAAVGKNGFRLSLFGYDKELDHRTLTRELRGRRLDPAEPDQSLMLQKPAGQVAHKGGKRLQPDAPMYDALHDWIAAGAPSDLTNAPALVAVELLPHQVVMTGPGQKQRFLVRAVYADGSDRDVTATSLLSSSNESSAAVDDQGVATAAERGEAFVMARYGTFAVVSQVLVLPDDQPFTWPDVPAFNYVDEAIHDKLRKLRIVPAELCSDAVFLRRVHLDLLNLLPTVDEARAFLADSSPDKRQALVARLLDRPEFAETWAMEWAEVLEVSRQVMEEKGAFLLSRYLKRAFADRRPFDEVVRELLTSQGGSFVEPTANFYLTDRTANVTAEKVAQNFLGVRMQCAQCHNHPFESWTMDDYYGFAAFFARIGRKRGEDYREWIVYDRGSGVVRHKRDNSVVAPKFLGGERPKIPAGTDWRQVLAKWLTSDDNPWFAANVGNRVWARMFGRGLVDPADDVRISNPASHPDLYRRLGRKLVEYGFDIRPLVADICGSRTYQLARHDDEPPAALFAGNQVRRLTAEQMLDAIGQVTSVPTKYRGLPLGAPATAIADGTIGLRFLDVFGRPTRTSACTCDRRDEPTLSQALHLINGQTIERKIRDGKGRLRKALAAKSTAEAMLEELFLAAWSRPPTAAEKKDLLPALAESDKPQAFWEDLYWAVLNSKEFLFNH